jgi:hypothetical protein
MSGGSIAQITFALLERKQPSIASSCVFAAILALAAVCAIYAGPGAGLRVDRARHFEVFVSASPEQSPPVLRAADTQSATTAPVHAGRSAGDRVRLKVPSYGCTNPKDAAKVTSFVVTKDLVGGIQTALRAKCRLFDAGPLGVIEGPVGPGAVYCLRPDSERECFWMSDVWLR